MKKIIKTKNTEFEQNLKDYAIIDVNFRAGKPILLNEEELSNALATSDNSIKTELDKDFLAKNIKKDIEILGVTGTVVELVGESLEVIPKRVEQIIVPSTGKNGIASITIAAIPDVLSVTTIPEDGATDIYVGTTITITFNNSIVSDNSTFDILVGEVSVEHTKAIDETNKIVTLTPTDAFDVNTDVTISVDAEDIYGFVVEDTIEFTTALE